MGNKSTKIPLVFPVIDVPSGLTSSVSGFRSVAQLYQKLGEVFGYPPDQILFCTVNTPYLNMDALLSAQLLMSSTIYVHRKGRFRIVELRKTSAKLGITLTDNGCGTVFIKRLTIDSPAIGQLNIGEGISSINDTSMFGWRHHQAVKLLIDAPIGEIIKIVVLEPLLL